MLHVPQSVEMKHLAKFIKADAYIKEHIQNIHCFLWVTLAEVIHAQAPLLSLS